MAKKKKPVVTGPKPGGKGWQNKQDGKAMSGHNTKAAAVEAGKKQAKKDQTEHKIQRKDGVITQSNSYGNDPNPPKDKK